MRVYEDALAALDGCTIDKIYWHAQAEPPSERRIYEHIEASSRTRFIEAIRGRKTFEIFDDGQRTDAEPEGLLDPTRRRERASPSDLATIAARLGMPLHERSSWTPASWVMRLGESARCEAADLIALPGPETGAQRSVSALGADGDSAVIELDQLAMGPPSHLSEWLTVSRLQEPVSAPVTEALDSADSRFLVSCSCEPAQFILRRHGLDGATVKLVAHCRSCSRTCVVHDHGIHGYDARALDTATPCVPPSAEETLLCETCQRDSFQLFLGYQTQVDEELVELAEELQISHSDLYMWIFAIGECLHCGALQPVLDLECA